MSIDGALEGEIELVQILVDRIVANEASRTRTSTFFLEEPAAGPAGRLEMEALGRFEALAQSPTLSGVLFGMLFLDTGDTILIGGRAITDAEGEPVVVDWRAPLGSRFFQCSVEDPQGVIVRRRIRSRGTLVLGIDDEHLMSDIRPPRPLVGEGALLADPVAADPAMAPIVATLRDDQDRAVRASRRGDTIVLGPPGTGKTVVALNRASYLDFVDRNKMFERHPVAYLVPTPSFAAYISGVLPALGDTSTRLAHVPQFLAEIATLAMGPDAVALAHLLDGIDVATLGSGRARRRWRSRRVAQAARQDRVIRCRSGLLAVGSDEARRLVAETSVGTWASSRRRLMTALGELATRRYPHSAREERQAAAAQVMNQLMPKVSVATVVADILAHEQVTTPSDRTDAPSTTALGALLMLFVECGGARALRRSVSEPQVPVGAEGDLPADVDASFEWNGNSLAATLAHSFATTEGFVSRQAELWLGSASSNSWAHDHLIIDECQDLSPEVFRALRAAYPSAGRTLVGDLAQSCEPRWYPSTEDLLRVAGTTRHTLHQLSHNYRNDRLIAEHVNHLGASIPGSLAAIPVRPQLGDLHVYPLEDRELDLDAIRARARLTDSAPIWIGDSSSPVPDGFLRSDAVKGHEFSNVVVVVDPSCAPSESLTRSLYVSVSRARHRCDISARSSQLASQP